MNNTLKNTQLSLQISDLSFDGQGIARLGRDVYFVAGALPGEQVTARLKERRKKIWFCELVSIEQPSEQRQSPPCPHYERCGGCDLQHLQDAAQVEFKQARVMRELERKGLTVEQWLPAVTAAAWHYRRRARLGVRFSKDKEKVYIGFREANNVHLAEIDQCPVLVEHPALNWQDWSQRLVSLECRARVTQIEMLQAENRLVLVFRVLKQLSSADRALFRQWANELDIDIYCRPDEGELLALSESQPLYHQVMGHQLNIHPDYFVQVNESVNQQMVSQALSWLDLPAGSKVWDLFAGHGNFSVPMAVENQVHAVEASEEMVAALRSHAQSIAGQSAGVQLIAHKADLSDSDSLKQLPDADFVLLDPPRAGAAETIEAILAQAPKRILYVSCDAATLSRDLVALTQGPYCIRKAGILDMFPNTHHVETMVLLEAVASQDKKQDKKRLSQRGGLKKPPLKSLHRRNRGASRG